MSKPIAIIINDVHIQHDNVEDILNVILQAVDKAIELNIDWIILAGDIFISRIAQREETLRGLDKLLEILRKIPDVRITIIPGNHDKTSYSSENSFLDTFAKQPNVELMTAYSTLVYDDNLTLHFLPFFTEEILMDNLRKIKCELGIKNILISHFAVNGSVNNDGSKVSSSINAPLLAKFDQVYLGHYHNTSKPMKNVLHMPSIRQANFGEDDNKGFTILDRDGSYKIENTTFKRFEKVQIDLDSVDPDELRKIVKTYSKHETNVRFIFHGNEEKLKSIKKETYTSLGIDVKTKHKDLEITEEENENFEPVVHTKQSILDAFLSFCEKNELDTDRGLMYLNKKLKNG